MALGAVIGWVVDKARTSRRRHRGLADLPTDCLIIGAATLMAMVSFLGGWR